MSIGPKQFESDWPGEANPPKMSSTGAGYDYSPTVYSPDGRMYQAEYAAKAVQNAGTSIGIRCKDGKFFQWCYDLF